jgi:hypothetical protein
MVTSVATSRFVLLSADLVGATIVVAFWIYVGVPIRTINHFLILAAWNALPFILLHVASKRLSRRGGSRSTIMVAAGAGVVIATVAIYGRLLFGSSTRGFESYEPNLIWIFGPAVLLLLVLVSTVASLLIKPTR